MTWLRRFVSEPLFQFLVIGAVIFGTYSALNRPTDKPPEQSIIVTPGQVAQLMEVFSRTWQRPPTADELRGLIDAYLKEEIYYREGRKLGLDENDTVFRRRLQQKMEFLMEPSAAELTPEDGELEAFFEANRASFRLPARYGFEQIYFNPEKRGDAALSDATEALQELLAGDVPDPLELGDQTMLSPSVPLLPTDRIELTFGSGFAAALADAPVGEWTGPVRSSFGLHLVRVDEKTEARDPPLAEVIGVVTREWEDKRRREIADERYKEMRERYDVIVEMPETRDGPSQASPQATAPQSPAQRAMR